jgi:hypothetical protein
VGAFGITMVATGGDMSNSGPTRNIVLEGRIDPGAGTVTFQSADTLDLPLEVHLGDSVRWDLAGVPAGWRSRIRFVRFPDGPEPTLLAHGNSLEGERTIDGGTIQPSADGLYAYVIELVGGKGAVTRLDVVTQGGETTTRAEDAALQRAELAHTGSPPEGNPGGTP